FSFRAEDGLRDVGREGQDDRVDRGRRSWIRPFWPEGRRRQAAAARRGGGSRLDGEALSQIGARFHCIGKWTVDATVTLMDQTELAGRIEESFARQGLMRSIGARLVEVA